MNLFRRLLGKNKAAPKKQYASLEEEIEDLRRFCCGRHPTLSDLQWLKESIKLAKNAERAYKTHEAIEHWKRVAALGKADQKALTVAMGRIKELQSMSEDGNWEAMARQSLTFAKECEASGNREEATKHYRRVLTLAPKGSEMAKLATGKLSG